MTKTQQKKPAAGQLLVEGGEKPALGDRLLYPKSEAAYLLGISLRALEYLLTQRRLRYRKLGGRTLIPRAELVKFAKGDQTELIRSA